MGYKDPEKQREYQRLRHLNNPDRLRKVRAEYKAAIYSKINQFKENPCTDCGNRFDPVCMDFDHISDNKKNNVSDLVKNRRPWDEIYLEILKCELVCANCHRIRTRNRRSNNHY